MKTVSDSSHDRQKDDMRCRKAMTKAKIDANRQNSKRSTGPRTERGKRIARFNAVTLGLFAKHIVIPICDGYRSEKEFQSLLDGLHQEFQPAGIFEEWLVVKIAECMWRLRRAVLCENGSVRESAAWTRVPKDDSLAPLFYTRKISILTDAEEQIRETGTLTPKTYSEVQRLDETDSEYVGAKLIDLITDQVAFFSTVSDHKNSLQSMLKAAITLEDRRCSDELAHRSLPPTEDMDKILRYEERMHRQLDWALQRLLETQETRKNAACVSAKCPDVT